MKRTIRAYSRLADPPKWYAKPGLNLEKYATVKGYLNHLNAGRWGGNYRKQQPLWPSLEDINVDSKIIAYTAGHPLDNLSTEHKLDTLTKLQSKHPLIEKDKSNMKWEEAGLDNVLSSVLSSSLGDGPNDAQLRVLQLLVAHSTPGAAPGDVLASMPIRSGKTTLLLIGLMHAIRTEDAGLNMMFCASAQACYNCYNAIFGMLSHFEKNTGVDPAGILGAADRSWILVAPFRDDAETYVSLLMRSRRHPRGPVRIIITTPDVWNDMEGSASMGKLHTASFGYLRRLFVDDIQTQLALPSETASNSECRQYDTDPPAVSLALAHIHQRLSAPTRALLQLALIANDLETRTKNFLHQLCLNIYNTKEVLTQQCNMLAQHNMFSFLYHHERSLPALFGEIVCARFRSQVPRCVILTTDKPQYIDGLGQSLGLAGFQLSTFWDVVSDGSEPKVGCDWQFLLLQISEFELIRHLPEFTHLVFIDTPRNRFDYAHILKGLDTRLSHICLVHIWKSAGIRVLAETLDEMNVKLEKTPVWLQQRKPIPGSNTQFTKLDMKEVYTRVKPLEKWGLNPQHSVENRYIAQDDPIVTLNADLRKQDSAMMYAKEDYTPLGVQSQRYNKTKQVYRETVKNQEIVSEMLDRKMINPRTLKPTEHMWDWLHK
ncbi:ATP dependent DEAD-box helicase [Perkinsela sp. CCAP 1560/4]|nr:ATP dependent DEAD-box helicase [Perkinsela sp. CCAP 1560/4]KNH09104.1 ATP dependent DEAD-box helicase [Perkinsela sp. CCAP 1560/4]|eukprot:KNH05334.1 ATP dependent DEAD-box helicase [Perkinsela sp. CCAP 1560/4]